MRWHLSVEEDLDEQEPERHRRLLADVLLPGALVGTFGAFASALCACLLSAAFKHSFWWPAILVGGVFFRDEPSAHAVAATVLGLVVHIGLGGALATAFALLLPRGSPGFVALLLGVAFGFSLQVLMPSLVLPFASPPLARTAALGTLLAVNLSFGVTLGLVPSVRHSLGSVRAFTKRARRFELH